MLVTHLSNASFKRKSMKNSYLSSDPSRLDSKNHKESQKKLQHQIKQSKQLQPTEVATPKISMTNSQIYINFGVTKHQPQISRVEFPYYLQDDECEREVKKKAPNPISNIKITNRVFTKKSDRNQYCSFTFFKVENQEPPINQFLSYDLSKQINNGLYEVKVLAEEIKKIKKDKLELLQDQSKYKPQNKIRIAKAYRSVLAESLCRKGDDSQLEGLKLRIR